MPSESGTDPSGILRHRVTRAEEPQQPPPCGPRDPIPEELLNAIRGGRCVAFVGAGFSIPADVPDWGGLLLKVHQLGAPGESDFNHIHELVGQGGAHSLDQAAQYLKDKFDGKFVELVRQAVAGEDWSIVDDRLWYLLRIPFRAILTTNFDAGLPGSPAVPAVFRRILGKDGRRPWANAFWNEPALDHVVKLHGDVTAGASRDDPNPIVLTRQDYRRRVYDSSAYAVFLRSIFANYTVLFLGCSLQDAYLNELRSEVFSMLWGADKSATEPCAYAVMDDVSPATRAYYLRHEAIEVLSFARSYGPNAFSGFDWYLRDLYAEANPLPLFALHLSRRRILWVDPNRDGNLDGRRFIERARARVGGTIGLEPVDTAEQATAALIDAERRGAPFDLVITRWGKDREQARGESTAEHVLRAARISETGVPVIVFTGRDDDERRRRAFALGAAAFTDQWELLFLEIARVFGDRALLGTRGASAG